MLFRSSLLTSDWSDVLSKLDKVLNRDDILALDKQDYSEKNGYHKIISALYKRNNFLFQR